MTLIAGTGGTVATQGHTYVIEHATRRIDQTGELGFKIAYLQLPCNSVT